MPQDSDAVQEMDFEGDVNPDAEVEAEARIEVQIVALMQQLVEDYGWSRGHFDDILDQVA